MLSPAFAYFAGVLQAILASDPTVTTVSLLYSTTSFGKDVATGVERLARNARVDQADQIALPLFGIPERVATFLGLPAT